MMLEGPCNTVVLRYRYASNAQWCVVTCHTVHSAIIFLPEKQVGFGSPAFKISVGESIKIGGVCTYAAVPTADRVGFFSNPLKLTHSTRKLLY
jgi:hypothetical protein